MTLYKALRMTRNASDEGWVIHMPDGSTIEAPFWGVALDEIMDHPEWLTLSVSSMKLNEQDEYGRIHVWTEYGSEYISNSLEQLGWDGLQLGMDEAIRLVVGNKDKTEITLGEIYRITDVLDNTVSAGDVIASLG